MRYGRNYNRRVGADDEFEIGGNARRANKTQLLKTKKIDDKVGEQAGEGTDGPRPKVYSDF